MLRWLLLYALLLALPAAAQLPPDPEMTQNRAFRVKFQVPAHWLVSRQRTDSVELLRYHDPADGAHLWVARLRGRHAHTRPVSALQRLLRQLGATHHAEHRATAHGLDYLESTGTCRVGGRELRYDARVTTYQGQVLLVYLYATPTAFNTQAPLLHRVLDSFAPLPAD
ncbi:hypothetical protein EJV47_01400 [Hymenobacter gummosus]|uniref:DUF1795 domain-containing protein n=1 Tax=Hymenobacter gummosus TaxID=1776032 RepID=A0A431U848_9BACT|nr:hypothetical protein [Hymenobacter gummosus]RTQ53423.1 hypothetical protein EJV47_01400 [Hymenobacter gummosus]